PRPWLGLALLLPVAVAAAGCGALRGPDADRAPEVLVRPQAPPEYDYLVARQLELDGDLEQALAAYGRALEKDPDAAILHRRMAELLARLGRPGEAVVHAERAHALAPDDHSLRLLLGTLYRLQRDLPAAARVLRDASGQPIDGDASLLLYGLYTDQGMPERALELARWLVRSDPTNLRSYFALARAFEQLDRHQEAERALRSALEQHPRSLAVYAALARGRRERGGREGEIAIYREVLAFQPRHHPTLVALADAQIALERWDDARETLEEIERAYPDDLRSIVRLGYLDLEQGRYDTAAGRFERAL